MVLKLFAADINNEAAAYMLYMLLLSPLVGKVKNMDL